MLRRYAFLLFLLAVLPARAQDGLLSPAAFLGYELGERFTPHHRVVAYVEHVAAHSPNVRVEHYGTTYEGRPLLVAYVARPDELARLEAVRLNNLRRARLAPGTPEPGPAVVWLSYNVHGNEAVSTEAALATLYDLANPQNARAQAWLQNTVVVLDPCVNPDGRDRYVQWYNQMLGRWPDPDPRAREHDEPWPGGRFNHYYFDLNRDWAWRTQRETQQRLPLYNRWMPQVHVDFHEQGVDAPYYFAPAAEPYHARITPWQRTFQTTIGRNNARYFDQAGRLYFTRQVFDLFYPGYGDTWPTFNGAVGMTYEQGGSGRAGLAIETAEGDTLTLRYRIENHHTTGLSTVEAAAQNHAAVVQNFVDYFATAPEGPYRAFVVKPGASPDGLRALARLLDAQGIRYGTPSARRTVRGLAYRDGRAATVAAEPGDLVVSLDQPKATLAAVLFEPNPPLADSLTYDITAWALPYAYGLEAYALTEPLRPDADLAPAPGGARGAAQAYAYVAPWQSVADARFLAAALRKGLRVRFSERPLEVEGTRYPAGALLFTRRGNEALGSRFDAALRQLADSLGQTLQAVATGFVSEGPDFGSGDVAYLRRPRVAVLAGEPLSPMAVGEVWHFFEERLGYPATLLNARDFAPSRLRGFDVLVLPSGSYGAVLNEERLKEVRAWVQGGGRLIALEGAAAFLAGKEGFALKRKPAGEAAAKDSLAARLQPYGSRERDALGGEVPGAVYRVVLDATHPLAFGLGDDYYTLKRGDAAFSFLEDGWNVGVLREAPPRAGFAGSAARKRLENTLVFGVQDLGRGEVVYFIDSPLFRGLWHRGLQLFSNAVFLVGQQNGGSAY